MHSKSSASAASTDVFTIQSLIGRAVVLNINGTETFCVLQDDGFPESVATFLSANLQGKLISIAFQPFRNQQVAVVTYHSPEFRVLLLDGELVQKALTVFSEQSSVFDQHFNNLSVYIQTILVASLAEKVEEIKPQQPTIVQEIPIRTIDDIPKSRLTNRLKVTEIRTRGLSVVFLCHHLTQNTISNVQARCYMLRMDWSIIRNHIRIHRGDIYVKRTSHRTTDDQTFVLDWKSETLCLILQTGECFYVGFDAFIDLKI